jgi:methionyl-tRNA synthetase
MTSATFLSTTIPYVNSRPHVGHALEFVQTDAAARFARATGRDVYFLTGSDDNSLKNVLAAEREGLRPAELVARNVVYFQQLQDLLEVAPDWFIRTSVDEVHRAGATELWKRLDARGDLYLKDYSGLYCVGCEQFYSPDELTADGLCPEHLVAPEEVRERNWFFRLSRYAEPLLEALSSGRMRIHPASRLNEVRAFVEAGLSDISVSRSVERARGWGIPVPGDESQVMYVWIDALTNYVNALDWTSGAEAYRRFWAGADQRVHVLGKGVIRFHAVYWPAMLLGAELPLPTDLVVHGYVTVEGRKIGKSLGNAVDTAELVERLGTPDPVRYFLLADVAAFGDGDFSEERLVQKYNNDLANGLGNLVNRVASMTGRYRGGAVPAAGGSRPEHRELLDEAAAAASGFTAAMAGYDHRTALGHVMSLTRRTNAYIDACAPWHLAKAEAAGEPDAAGALDSALHGAATAVLVLGRLLQVHLPGAAERIGRIFPDEPGGALDAVPEAAGVQVRPGSPVFPRIDVTG